MCEYFGRMDSWKTYKQTPTRLRFGFLPQHCFAKDLFFMCTYLPYVCISSSPRKAFFISWFYLFVFAVFREFPYYYLSDSKVSMHFNSLIGREKNAIKTSRHLQYSIFLFLLIPL